MIGIILTILGKYEYICTGIPPAGWHSVRFAIATVIECVMEATFIGTIIYCWVKAKA